MMFIFVLMFILLSFTPEKVLTCKIVESYPIARMVLCVNEGVEEVAILTVEEWPEEWNDSTKVGDAVKIKVTDDNVYVPMLSCKARMEITKKKYKSRKVEARIPANLPIDIDCQGQN